MASNVYDKGDEVRFSCTFKDLNGNAVDPTTVVFKIKDPSSNVTTYTYGTDSEVVKDSTGNYHVDYVVDESGTWSVRWEGSGNISAAGEQKIYVRISSF